MNRDVELITDKITTLERQLERWKVAYAGEAITLDEFAALKKPLDAEISALSRLHDELQGKLSVIHHRQEEINAAADKITLQGARYPEHLQKLVGR